MAISLQNYKALKPVDQYEIDTLDFERRVEDFHRMIPGTMRRMRNASNTTEEGRRMRQEWRHCGEEYEANKAIMSEQGQDIDGDFFTGLTNALVLTFIGAVVIALLAAKVLYAMGWVK